MKCSSHWLEVLPGNESLDILRDIAWTHACEAGPYETVLKDLIHRCRFKEMCQFEVDYSLPGLTVNAVRHTRQVLALFSKLEHLDIGVDREVAGMRTFLDAELLNRETNSRFKMRRAGTLGFPARVERAFLLAQRKIRRVLGDKPPLLEDLTLRFGPGSTRKTRKADASTRAKCAEGITCSEELISLLPTVLRELPHLTTENARMTRVDEDGEEWDQVLVEIVASALCFVFKNALTYRLIGIEALLNLMVQLAYGIEIAKRLACIGLDIRDQTRNQRLAQYGSLTGESATLDLRSASDNVAIEPVYELLPLDWVVALARCRSAKIKLPDGTTISQEKFSAMGNGFTFPLETLIFWALASSVCEDGEVCTVYGDDIIVPSKRFADVCEVLRYAGFNVNEKKSFASGPFRESCGTDWFEGIDVRPFYQKEWISGRSLFVLHNWYVRHGDGERAKFVMKFIHPSLFIFGPDGFGDGHLIGDHQRRRSPSQDRAGYSGYFFESFTTKSRKEVRKDINSDRGDYPASLYSIYVRGESDPDNLRGNEDPGSSFFRSLTAKVRDGIESLVAPGSPIPVDDQGRKTWSLPGQDGYKKIRIYTLGG